MDFQQLLARMQELDQPATEHAAITDEGGCGMDSPMAPPLSAVPPKPDVPPPSMSVNINAQGMENIEDMMKLFTKVNPDMMPAVPPPMPTIDIIPGMGGDKSMGPPEMKPINKLLPDFDADNDDMPGGEIDLPPDHDKDHAMIKTLDKDDDGDHDMDDHKKEKEESWKNEPDEEYRDIGAAIHDGTDEHREKGTYPKVAGGDNPMQKFRESENLRAQIRDDLRRRLAEAKGAK